MARRRSSGLSILFRILTYLKSYWPSLVGSITCVIFFVIFSSMSLFAVMPLLSTLFGVEGGAAMELLEGGNDSASEDANTTETVQSRVNELRDSIKMRVYTLFLGDDWQSNRWHSLYRFCVILILIMVLKNLFDYLQKVLMAFVEQGIIRDIRNDIYNHLSRLSLNYFGKTRTGQLISRITNDVNLVNGGVSAGFFTLVKNPLLIMVSLIIAFYLSWQLTLVTLLIMPISALIISYIGLRLRKKSTVSQERMADVTSVLQETISGMRVVKAFGMEKFESRKFAVHTDRYFRTLINLVKTRNLASPLNEVIGTIVAICILYFGGTEVLRGNILAPEEFMMFLMVIFSMMQPIKEISTVNNRLQEAIAAGTRIFSLMDTDPEIRERPGAKAIGQFTGSVSYKNVTFSYTGDETVLKDIDIEVNKGSVLAIVGPSGAGKSTFVDMLPRFYDPQGGAIEIDGIDLRDLRINDLRSLLGIVTQETILFNDTVRNNIAYGVVDTPLEKIIEAAKAANAHHFIMKMDNQYDTPIGERGVKVSGGERQRLAIARAILKDPPILILDEATSSLDTQSEQLVQEAMERLMKNRTSFVIAHRLSTILHADMIIVMENGSIVERGTHLELLKKKGLYKKLYDMQFRDVKIEA